jgi:ribosomal protein S18 acetylase RimI-like enzyme
MTLPTVTIRRAEASDIVGVRRLLLDTWHDTYDALIGVERVNEITGSWHSLEALSRQLHMEGTAFLLAQENGEIVGHALAIGQRPPTLILARLYVAPNRQRRGIGGRLLQAAIDAFPQADIVQLDVEADNPKGLGFYRRMGFQPVGERVEAGINHLRMEKSLKQAA